uniref:Prefoldin subunit 3 n=1 Tax=Embidopsocus sp. OG10733 TaxID=2530297 RepID=A0A481SW18_9NEOP|nr:prefoldin subunit [Embidopsocus sp. OG10733]
MEADQEKNKPGEKKAEPAESKAEGDSTAKLHMGIPEAEFVDDVEAFMALPENSGNADKVLKKFDEQHSKYKFMQYNLASKRRRLKKQIPEVQKSIEMLAILEGQKNKKKEMTTEFLLSDQVYMKATIPPTEKVFLWLGADVMLEYDLQEASELLKKNLATAKKNLLAVEKDLDFLRDQFTTTEVNMARVFNWDVKRRQNQPK